MTTAHDTPPAYTVRRIVFAVYPGTCMLDLAGAQTVFWCASRHLEQRGLPGYALVTASVDGAPVTTAEGTVLAVASLCDPGFQADTVLVPGATDIESALLGADSLIEWLRGVDVRRIASVCTGSFMLAAAGRLDGHRATTHWAVCDRLAIRYPNVNVQQEAVYVRDDPVWTSAGVSTGIDMALAMVEADHGHEIAMLVAQELVIYVRRAGSEPQHSDRLALQAGDGAQFDGLHRWIADHLASADLSVERLARQACMSPRNFARVYRQKTGRTPAKAIEQFRLDAARRLLQQSDRNLEQIAQACGFGDPDRMRTSFQRNLGLSPSAYRRQHA
ncbi:GlxA family transcriptional regulator [Massilia niastensis]|uniref:GlxA family transcriptional regulator n=1 Tax=Massilia niastensis TaxID=544911 RepID=UPI000380AE70|nr:helix-turn-helix domain-containing protein [Massilia niastensis]